MGVIQTKYVYACSIEPIRWQIKPAGRPPGRQETACRSAARPPRKSLPIGRPAAKKKPAGPAGKACPHVKAAAKGGPAWPMQSRAGLAA